MEHEKLIRDGAKERFPSCDPNWMVEKWMEKTHEYAKKTAEILALMAPEVRRVWNAEQERMHEQTKARSKRG